MGFPGVLTVGQLFCGTRLDDLYIANPLGLYLYLNNSILYSPLSLFLNEFFLSKLSQVVNYFSIVTPLIKSTEFKTKRSIIYLCSWKDVFITKPIKTKHVTFTNRGNEGKLSLPND